MLNLFSDPYLVLALAVGTGTVVLTLLVAAVIVYLRLDLRRRQRRAAQFLVLWRPLLLQAAAEGVLHEELPQLRHKDQFLFLKLWNYLQESLRGSANVSLSELAKRLHCDAAARDFLKHGNRAERLLGILTLGHLHDEASWDMLTHHESQSDSLISIHAARALIKIDPLRGTKWLLPMLVERRDWSIAQIANFLGEARQAFWLELSKNLFALKENQWPRALQLADALRLELSIRSILFILKHARLGSTLIAALQLANDVRLLPAVRYFRHHSDWRIRVEVAWFLGKFGNTNDVDVLQYLLRDKHWWVRYQAAHALVDMPFFGPENLQLLRTSTAEMQVIEMLEHVLAEHRSVMA